MCTCVCRVGVGVSATGTMLSSLAVVARPGVAGSSAYYLTDASSRETAPQLTVPTLAVNNVSVLTVGALTALTVIRTMAHPSHPVNATGGDTAFVWAVGNSATLSKHQSAGVRPLSCAIL